MAQIYSPSSTPVRETRTLRVQASKGLRIDPGASLTIFSATGPGNVDRIQFAASYSSNTSGVFNVWVPYITITITVDGGTPQTAPLGLFFLLYGYNTSDAGDATGDEFATKYLGIPVAASAGGYMGVYRRIYIKYNTSCTITLNSPSTNGYIYPFTQVDYYSGAAPAGLFPATRDVFHLAVNDWATSTIAPSATLNILPTVTGSGELESIYYVSSATGASLDGVNWLEMPPTILVDGTSYIYKGTEDFFGNQFYGTHGIHAKADEYGLARAYVSGSPDGKTYWTAYRYFKDAPMIFNSSIAMTWQNAAGANQWDTPATQVGSLATYYTAN